MTLVLVGQPELGERVRSMPQLDQRVAVRHHLTPLSPNETRSYVEHRLRIAGLPESPFTEEAIRAVKKWRFEPATSGGISLSTEIDVTVTFGL